MIKALRITMIVFGAIGILVGLSDMIVPDLGAKLLGFGAAPDYVIWIVAMLGANYLAGGIWVIAASRDPIRHINWVKFVITKSLLFTVVTAYAIIQGYVNFSQVGALLIGFAIFSILFLVFYPWRVKESTQ